MFPPQNNYTNWVFLLGRVFDKLVFSVLTVVYYWKVGRDFSPSNAPNLAGVLFLWCVHKINDSSMDCPSHF